MPARAVSGERGARVHRARGDAAENCAELVALASRPTSGFSMDVYLITMLLRFVIVARCIKTCAASPGPSDAAWWKTGKTGKSCKQVCSAISATADITRLAALNSEAEGLFANAVVTADVQRWNAASYAVNLLDPALTCTSWSAANLLCSNNGGCSNTYLPAQVGSSCKWMNQNSASTSYYDISKTGHNTQRLCCCVPWDREVGKETDTQLLAFFCPLDENDCGTVSAGVWDDAPLEKRCRIKLPNSAALLFADGVCPPGRYIHSSSPGNNANGSSFGHHNLRFCPACPAGRLSAGGANQTLDVACERCATGRYATDLFVTSCKACGLGKFATAGKGQNNEKAACAGRCPKGTYGTAEGQNSSARACNASCSAGKWSGSVGLSSDAECPWCLAGRYSALPGLTAASQCEERCSPGRFGVGFVPHVVVTSTTGCSSPFAPITERAECRRGARALGYLPDAWIWGQENPSSSSSSGYHSFSWVKAVKDWGSSLDNVKSYPYGCSVQITKWTYAQVGGDGSSSTSYASSRNWPNGTVMLQTSDYVPSDAALCSPNFPCICKYNATIQGALDYADPPTSSAHCSKCLAGRYSSSAGLTGPDGCSTSCSAGRWSNRTGLTSDSECFEFPKGLWSKLVGATSTDDAFDPSAGLAGRCVPGRWSNRTGVVDADGCRMCKQGKFTAALGRTS